MNKRNIIEEIEQKRVGEFYDIYNWFHTLRAAFTSYKNVELHPEFLKYFPISLVSFLENFYRASIKELVNSGDPYFEKISKFKNINPDFTVFRAVQDKKITVGDFIAHLLPLSSLEHINGHLSILLDKNFLDELKPVIIGWDSDNNEMDPKMALPLISQLFQVRHKIAHEDSSTLKIDIDEIERYFKAVDILVTSTKEYIYELLGLYSSLTQAELTEKAMNDFNQENEELERVHNSIKSFLSSPDYQTERTIYEHPGDEDYKSFLELIKVWDEFKVKDSKFEADFVAKGGTLWRTIYYMHASIITADRKKELRERFKTLLDDTKEEK